MHCRCRGWRKHDSTVFGEGLYYGLNDASEATPIGVFSPEGADTFVTYHLPHTHLELEGGSEGIRYQRPLGTDQHMLPQGLLNLGENDIHGLLCLGTRCLACDIQEMYNQIFRVTYFDCLLPCLSSSWHGQHRVLCGPLLLWSHTPSSPFGVFLTRKVDGEVGVFHVACGGLHCLLPAGHDRYYTTDVMGVNVGDVLQGLLCLKDDLMKGSEVAFFQIQDALGHLTESVTKVAQYLGLINSVRALRACSCV